MMLQTANLWMESSESGEYLPSAYGWEHGRRIRFEGLFAHAVAVSTVFLSVAFIAIAPSIRAAGADPAAALDSRNAFEYKISSSDVVVYGRVQQLLPIKGAKRDLAPGFDEVGTKKWVPESNSFTFHVISTLKGVCPAVINIEQSPSTGVVGISPACGKGDSMLFFLKRDGPGFSPVTPQWEIFLPGTVPSSDTLAGNCYDRVIACLLFAMSDSKYGSFDSCLLEGVYDPTIADKIKPFAANADLGIRGEALNFLAHNQVVNVIPLIRKAQEDAESQGWSLAAPLGLQDYVVPSALPLLNPLLFSTSWQVRGNAESSIIRFHNPSSIPYLMVALYDPEKQNTIAYLAYCELSTYMGFHPVSLDRFYSDRAEAEMPVFSWWKLELLGKHGAQNQAEKEQRAAKPAAALPERLFDSDLKVRRAEMTALEKRATTEDVPYLILALHDPDNSLSYRAYKTLFALLKLHSAQANEAAFAASPDVAEQPIILWWRNHFVNF